MGAEHVPGATGDVRVIIVSVDVPNNTASVRVVDDNGVPLTPAVSLPMELVRVTGMPVALNDVLEEFETGRTGVVRFVDPASPLNWSPSVSGVPLLTTMGWKKIGTFVPTPP